MIEVVRRRISVLRRKIELGFQLYAGKWGRRLRAHGRGFDARRRGSDLARCFRDHGRGLAQTNAALALMDSTLAQTKAALPIMHAL